MHKSHISHTYHTRGLVHKSHISHTYHTRGLVHKSHISHTYHTRGLVHKSHISHTYHTRGLVHKSHIPYKGARAPTSHAYQVGKAGYTIRNWLLFNCDTAHCSFALTHTYSAPIHLFLLFLNSFLAPPPPLIYSAPLLSTEFLFHTSNACKAAYIHIRHISSEHIFTTQASQTLVCSLILSPVMFYFQVALSTYLHKLQKVQNAAARLYV